MQSTVTKGDYSFWVSSDVTDYFGNPVLSISLWKKEGTTHKRVTGFIPFSWVKDYKKMKKRGPFSLRASLIEQGVTCETALKAHLNFVYETLLVNPLMDIRRYKINPNNPATALMG